MDHLIYPLEWVRVLPAIIGRLPNLCTLRACLPQIQGVTATRFLPATLLPSI